MRQEAADLAAGAVKAYPITVATATFLGFSLQEWVYVTAIAVATCQLAVFTFKFARWIRSFRVDTDA